MTTRISLDTREDGSASSGRPLGRFALAVLLLLVGAAIGFLRPTATPTTHASAPAATRSVAAPMDQVSVGDDTGVPELAVGLARADGATGKVGAAGLPVGFARSQDGAASAAAVYLAAWSSSAIWIPQTRAEIAGASVDTRDHRKAFDRQVLAEGHALGLDKRGQPAKGSVVVSSVEPTWGAYRVAAWSDSSAEVTVWHPITRGVVKRGASPPAKRWWTSTVALTWADGDWKMTAYPTHVDGPTPAPSLSPPTTAERARLLGSKWLLYATGQ